MASCSLCRQALGVTTWRRLLTAVHQRILLQQEVEADAALQSVTANARRQKAQTSAAAAKAAADAEGVPGSKGGKRRRGGGATEPQSKKAKKQEEDPSIGATLRRMVAEQGVRQDVEHL